MDPPSKKTTARITGIDCWAVLFSAQLEVNMNLSQSLILIALTANAGAAVAAQEQELKSEKTSAVQPALDLSFHQDAILGATRQAGAKWVDKAQEDGF